ncbi:hypothetical protein OWV82_015552 [Melia azedarach]|uniref:Uncharacterized protein n=1 Tax=Melia azedarach TaxID=155640 RepID=A0ACC1XT30_MELAZ|nr:hypothetical protein OWV82_015552 [Melia azedarach]
MNSTFPFFFRSLLLLLLTASIFSMHSAPVLADHSYSPIYNSDWKRRELGSKPKLSPPAAPTPNKVRHHIPPEAPPLRV